jgi:hypothetical protein
MAGNSRIPERLFSILRTAEGGGLPRFPPTEIFNEGWMLRLVLDAFESLQVPAHPLSFEPGSHWFSEARLESPFRPRMRLDALGEGPTNADGVIGRLELRDSTRAGLKLSPDTRQFVVVEAKMFSNLSAGTKNAPAYNQAARNVACMAEAVARTGRQLTEFDSLGFFVVAPKADLRSGSASNLESSVEREVVRLAIRQRIAAYESATRPEADELQRWEATYLVPFLDHLSAQRSLAVLTWEDCIEAIAAVDANIAAELGKFYGRCLSFAPGFGGKMS